MTTVIDRHQTDGVQTCWESAPSMDQTFGGKGPFIQQFSIYGRKYSSLNSALLSSETSIPFRYWTPSSKSVRGKCERAMLLLMNFLKSGKSSNCFEKHLVWTFFQKALERWKKQPKIVMPLNISDAAFWILISKSEITSFTLNFVFLFFNSSKIKWKRTLDD